MLSSTPGAPHDGIADLHRLMELREPELPPALLVAISDDPGRELLRLEDLLAFAHSDVRLLAGRRDLTQVQDRYLRALRDKVIPETNERFRRLRHERMVEQHARKQPAMDPEQLRREAQAAQAEVRAKLDTVLFGSEDLKLSPELIAAAEALIGSFNTAYCAEREAEQRAMELRRREIRKIDAKEKSRNLTQNESARRDALMVQNTTAEAQLRAIAVARMDDLDAVYLQLDNDVAHARARGTETSDTIHRLFLDLDWQREYVRGDFSGPRSA